MLDVFHIRIMRMVILMNPSDNSSWKTWSINRMRGACGKRLHNIIVLFGVKIVNFTVVVVVVVDIGIEKSNLWISSMINALMLGVRVEHVDEHDSPAWQLYAALMAGTGTDSGAGIAWAGGWGRSGGVAWGAVGGWRWLRTCGGTQEGQIPYEDLATWPSRAKKKKKQRGDYIETMIL